MVSRKLTQIKHTTANADDMMDWENACAICEWNQRYLRDDFNMRRRYFFASDID